MDKYIGVDIGGTKMYMLTEYDGKYIEKKVSTGVCVTKEYIKREIDDFIMKLPFIPKGIGIAIPGLVENTDTVISSDVVPCLNGLKSEYFSWKNCEVKLINDVRASIIEESVYYPDNYTMVVAMIGTGIAVSMKTNGKILVGAKDWAGELGLAPIVVDGKVCTVDNLSSGTAILQKAGTDIQTFLNMLEKEDERAISIIKDAGFYFGIALSIMINIFNPHVVIIGGGTSTYKGYMDRAIQTAGRYALKQSFDLCEITSPKDIKRVVALGARRFAYENNQ